MIRNPILHPLRFLRAVFLGFRFAVLEFRGRRLLSEQKLLFMEDNQ